MVESARSPRKSIRILALLRQILRDQGRVGLSAQAQALGLPISTAYRFASELSEAGFIRRSGPGAFAQSLELAMLIGGVDAGALLAEIARPHLQRLARRLQLTVHLGVLESDMVSYIVKEHGGGPELFTRAGTQLDAYCSAIGKVLLAGLPEAELEAYLNMGPLLPLTSKTIARSDDLKTALQNVRLQGYAVDAEEVMEDLRCIAVPISSHPGNIVAAASVSRRVGGGDPADDARILAALRDCAKRIAAKL